MSEYIQTEVVDWFRDDYDFHPSSMSGIAARDLTPTLGFVVDAANSLLDSLFFHQRVPGAVAVFSTGRMVVIIDDTDFRWTPTISWHGKVEYRGRHKVDIFGQPDQHYLQPALRAGSTYAELLAASEPEPFADLALLPELHALPGGNSVDDALDQIVTLMTEHDYDFWTVNRVSQETGLAAGVVRDHLSSSGAFRRSVVKSRRGEALFALSSRRAPLRERLAEVLVFVRRAS